MKPSSIEILMDGTGKPTIVTMRGTKILVNYSSNQIKLDITGKYPTPDILSSIMVLASGNSIDVINTVNTINLIKLIDTITTIGTIDKINKATIYPDLSSVGRWVGVNIPLNSSNWDTEVSGVGRIKWVLWAVITDADMNNLHPSIYVDGNETFPIDLNLLNIEAYISSLGAGNGVQVTKWNTVTHNYAVMMNVELPFRTSFKVGASNEDIVNAHIVYVAYLYELL